VCMDIPAGCTTCVSMMVTELWTVNHEYRLIA